MAAGLGLEGKKCSGKTLRYIKGQATRGNMSAFTGQYAILKERNGIFSASHSKDFEEFVQDGGLEAHTAVDGWHREPVMYSMNKRKRWLLPDMIADSIADKELHEDSDYQVIMVERDIPSYKGKCSLKEWKASCKAVHQTKSKGTDCTRAKKNCSYEEDLRRNPAAVCNRREERAERRRERARTGRRIPISSRRNRGAEREPRLPELRYEMLRPTPMHPFMLDTGWKPYMQDSSPPRDKRNLGHRKDVLHMCRLDANLYEDIHSEFDVDEEWPLHTVQDDEDCVKHLEDSTPFNLGSFITSSQPTNSCKRNRWETREKVGVQDAPMRKRYGKGCTVYRPDLATPEPQTRDSKLDLSDVDTFDSGFESDGSSTIRDDHTVSWLDLGTVAKECIHPDRLRMDFGQDYVEGLSVPRRFSICVKVVSASGIPVSASAVFALEDARQHPEIVNLRLRCCGADFLVQDVHQVIRGGISSPVVDMVSFMEELEEILSCHARSLEMLESNVCKSKRPDVTLETVQGMMGWSYNYDTIEHVKAALEDEEAECEQPVNRVSKDFCESEMSHEDSCGICFENLASPGGEDEEKGTALFECGHLFCNECWVHHVTNRVLMGETKIHCPAFKCESVVDQTTLLSLLPDALTHIHFTRLHDNRISGHPQWRWCPNPKCGRLVKVQGVHGSKTDVESGRGASEKLLGVPVPCECGVLWCSECQEAAHWPATCKQAAQHLQYMKDSGVDDVEKSERIRSVEVKRCPSCRNPMEKNGGCMHMVCNCGFSFCWECLAAWEDHDWTSWVFKCPQDRENLETVLLSSKKHQSVSYTELAIENRKMRTRNVVIKHHQEALRLAKRMYFVPKTDSCLHPFHDDLFPPSIRNPPDPIEWSYHSNQADQSRLTALVARATKMASFAAEVRILLEYVSILVGLTSRKLRNRRKGWKKMILRLMFIACRIEHLLESHQDRPAEDVWRRLRALLHQGQLCLKDITGTVPLLHKGLQGVKGQGAKDTSGEVQQKAGPPLV